MHLVQVTKAASQDTFSGKKSLFFSLIHIHNSFSLVANVIENVFE